MCEDSTNYTKLEEFSNEISEDLDRVMQFWLKYSHDEEYGGFFTCLGKKGELYDQHKYGWPIGRQVWIYAKLYNEVPRFRQEEIIMAAKNGAAFLMKYIRHESNGVPRCYFCVSRDGKPVKLQGTIFSECFYTMAMSEMAKATGNSTYREEALCMVKQIIHWATVDSSSLGEPYYSGQEPSIMLAYPMMVLCVLLELFSMDDQLIDEFAETVDWTVVEIFKHAQRNGTKILENVSPDGKELPGTKGRLMNPGHAIECGWFLLQVAKLRRDESLKQRAIDTFIVKPFEYAWDHKYGGIFYFLDADGLSPTSLEWNLKLWWVHSEAMVAFLMAYQETGNEEHLQTFTKLFNYCYTHFVDKECGEWYGYLNQQGEVNMDFKGDAFKGCFHVPRGLMMCESMLKELLDRTPKKLVAKA